MTAELLPDLARDLGGDAALVASVRAMLDAPPASLEEVGFYGWERFPPDMRCFLALVSRLEQAGLILAQEDKYVTELLDTFAERVALPGRMRSWFPKRLGWDGDYAAIGLGRSTHRRAEDRILATWWDAVAELEEAFEAAGTPLRLLQFHIGDTLPFVATTPEAAARWTDVAVAHDASGRPLGVTRPDWARFFHHLAYSMGLDAELPPRGAP
ncbi:MAG: hypothetical protein R3F61_07070 [Myxococcota bacterium]